MVLMDYCGRISERRKYFFSRVNRLVSGNVCNAIYAGPLLTLKFRWNRFRPTEGHTRLKSGLVRHYFFWNK